MQCSDWGINTIDVGNYAGYVWVRVGSSTSPSIYDLMGTPLALTTSAAAPVPEPPAVALTALAAAVAVSALLIFRKK